MDLTTFLSNDPPGESSTSITVNGQTLVVNPPDLPAKKRKVITNIHSWVQAYSMYAAALTSAETTNKSEAAGLLAHMYNVLQLAKDLGGNHWLQYDKMFREWAAAKNIRAWGELNLPIFCHCLATQQRSTYQPREQSGPNSCQYAKSGSCHLWNFEEACKRRGCRFLHKCFYCGGPHKAPNCPKGAKTVASRS